MLYGVLVVLLAAFLQGTFLAPMALTRKWKWEHSWAVLCLGNTPAREFRAGVKGIEKW